MWMYMVLEASHRHPPGLVTFTWPGAVWAVLILAPLVFLIAAVAIWRTCTDA